MVQAAASQLRSTGARPAAPRPQGSLGDGPPPACLSCREHCGRAPSTPRSPSSALYPITGLYLLLCAALPSSSSLTKGTNKNCPENAVALHPLQRTCGPTLWFCPPDTPEVPRGRTITQIVCILYVVKSCLFGPPRRRPCRRSDAV